MTGKVPNYAGFSDGQLDQAVGIKKRKDISTLSKPGNKWQCLSARIQSYSNPQIQQPNATTTKKRSNFYVCNSITIF